MDFKAIPFSHLSFDASLCKPTPEDFQAMIDGSSFFFDESEEAILLMSEEDKKAVADFDKKYS